MPTARIISNSADDAQIVGAAAGAVSVLLFLAPFEPFWSAFAYWPWSQRTHSARLMTLSSSCTQQRLHSFCPLPTDVWRFRASRVSPWQAVGAAALVAIVLYVVLVKRRSAMDGNAKAAITLVESDIKAQLCVRSDRVC